MVHMSEQPQLPVATFGVHVTLERSRELLYSYSDVEAGVKGRAGVCL